MATGVRKWSKTAATNGSADSAVNFSEGQAPSSVNDSARAVMASVRKWADDLNGTITTGGTSTAFTATSNQTFDAVAAGDEITVALHTANGATVTLNVDGLGAKPLRPAPNVELAAGQLKAGTPYRATYFTSNSGEWILHGMTDVLITGATALTAPAIDDEFPIYDLSATANRKITLANHLKVINGLTEDTSPDVAADFVLSYDASASAAKKVKLQNIPSILPKGYLHGCTLSNGTDTTNDIDISAGVCRDSTNTVDITISALAGKQLDANWAAGAAAGMRNSAAGIANATYHLYAARTAASATGDIYAYAGVAGTDPDSSASVAAVITALQAESGGSSYVYARRIGSILRESGVIVGFVQDGDYFRRKGSVLDITAVNPGTSAVSRTLSVPTGIKVFADVHFGASNAGAGVVPYGYLSDLDATDEAPNAGATPLAHSGAGTSSGGVSHSYTVASIRTNASGQIRSRISASDANVTLRIATLGWRDSRGRIA